MQHGILEAFIGRVEFILGQDKLHQDSGFSKQKEST